jgi:hypothetical protein
MGQKEIDTYKAIGYTEEQANLLDKIDDCFEEAVKLDMLTGDEAEEIGRFCGKIMGPRLLTKQ